MDWTRETNARLLATAYVVGFVVWLIGVLWLLYCEAKGSSVALVGLESDTAK